MQRCDHGIISNFISPKEFDLGRVDFILMFYVLNNSFTCTPVIYDRFIYILWLFFYIFVLNI